MKAFEKINVRIVRDDGTWLFNRLVWTVGNDRAYFESGSGFVIISDMDEKTRSALRDVEKSIVGLKDMADQPFVWREFRQRVAVLWSDVDWLFRAIKEQEKECL
jgi:hypothetical protein